jgi:flagellar biosynthesis protein
LPVREDPDLVHLLSGIELNESIPPELYRIVAEVMALIYKVNGKLE